MSFIRRGRRWLIAGAGLAALAALAPALVSGQTTEYSAELSGAEEVPSDHEHRDGQLHGDPR